MTWLQLCFSAPPLERRVSTLRHHLASVNTVTAMSSRSADLANAAAIDTAERGPGLAADLEPQLSRWSIRICMLEIMALDEKCLSKQSLDFEEVTLVRRSVQRCLEESLYLAIYMLRKES
eukprot:g30524.t1